MSTRPRRLDLVANILPGEAKGPLEQDNLAATLAGPLPSFLPVAQWLAQGRHRSVSVKSQVRSRSCIRVVALGARPEGESVTDME